ncbi:hypothetical protein HED48_22950 [Ochrobactrum intermedium]|nr:hypothetical protein [Brucella intermedia]
MPEPVAVAAVVDATCGLPAVRSPRLSVKSFACRAASISAKPALLFGIDARRLDIRRHGRRH